MFSQQMATRELLHSNSVHHYLGSYDFSDSAFSLNEGESQSIEFSQFPNSQELFSNQVLSGKEATPTKNQFGGQPLPSTHETNKEIPFNISKLRTMANERDERSLLENIANNLKKNTTELSLLSKHVNDMTEIRKEISSISKDAELQGDKLFEKINAMISSEFDNNKRIMSTVIEENEKGAKEAAIRHSQLQTNLKEQLDAIDERNKCIVSLQKMVISYQSFNREHYLEMKQQQNDLNRTVVAIREMVSALSVEMKKRNENVTDSLRSIVNLLETSKGSEIKDKKVQGRNCMAPLSTALLDQYGRENAGRKLMESALNMHSEIGTGKKAKRALSSPVVKGFRKKRKLKNNKFQRKKYSSKSTNSKGIGSRNSPIIFAEEGKVFADCMNLKQLTRRQRHTRKVCLQQDFPITTGNTDWFDETDNNNSFSSGCFNKANVSPRFYKSFEILSNIGTKRNENASNMFYREQKSCNKSSNSRMLSISTCVSEANEDFSSDSSSCLSITDLAGAIAMSARRHKNALF